MSRETLELTLESRCRLVLQIFFHKFEQKIPVRAVVVRGIKAKQFRESMFNEVGVGHAIVVSRAGREWTTYESS
jgi:hypothetical protein